jgi:hypothetical protein
MTPLGKIEAQALRFRQWDFGEGEVNPENGLPRRKIIRHFFVARPY